MAPAVAGAGCPPDGGCFAPETACLVLVCIFPQIIVAGCREGVYKQTMANGSPVNRCDVMGEKNPARIDVRQGVVRHEIHRKRNAQREKLYNS